MPAIASTTSTPSIPPDTLKSWLEKALEGLTATNPSEFSLAVPLLSQTRASTSSSVDGFASSFEAVAPVMKALALDGATSNPVDSTNVRIGMPYGHPEVTTEAPADGLPATNPFEPILAPPSSYRPLPSTSSSVNRPAPNDHAGTPVINALAFDGGGIRGVASAVVIDTIMKDYSAATGEAVNAADLFQLMGGTSTGGLIAMVLGRLEVTTEELVSIYETLSKQLFSYKLPVLRLLIAGSRYPGAPAKLLYSKIVEEHAPEGGSGVVNSMGNNSVGVPKCRVFVTATNKADATGDPLIISNYSQDSISIPDAARATTAAPFFFPAKHLPDGTVALDGGLGANNPTELVIKEAYAQYGPAVRFNLLLSIGTGRKRPTIFPEISVWSIIPFCQTLGDIATESEKVRKRVEARFRDQPGLGEYIRLNIPGIGDIHLDDYKSIPKIVEATKEYMETEEMKKTRDKIVALLSQREDPQKTDKTP